MKVGRRFFCVLVVIAALAAAANAQDKKGEAQLRTVRGVVSDKFDNPHGVQFRLAQGHRPESENRQEKELNSPYRGRRRPNSHENFPFPCSCNRHSRKKPFSCSRNLMGSLILWKLSKSSPAGTRAREIITGRHEKTAQVPTTLGYSGFVRTMGGCLSGAGSTAEFAAASSTQVGPATRQQQGREGQERRRSTRCNRRKKQAGEGNGNGQRPHL